MSDRENGANGTNPPSPENAWYRLDVGTRESIEAYLRHRRESTVKIWSSVIVALIVALSGGLGWFLTSWQTDMNRVSLQAAETTAKNIVGKFLDDNKNLVEVLHSQGQEVSKVAISASRLAAKAEGDAQRTRELFDRLEREILPVLKDGERLVDRLSRTSTSDTAEKSSSAGASTPASPFPQNAVLAFNRTSCPRGWSEWDAVKGRVIVGVDRTSKEPKFGLLETGGEAFHALTVDEMPAHNHRGSKGPASGVLVWGQIGNPGVINEIGIGDSATRRTLNEHTQLPLNISTQGKGTPHNNMPPYVALLLCKKD